MDHCLGAISLQGTYYWAELTQLVVARATYGSDMVAHSESAVENDTKFSDGVIDRDTDRHD